MPSERPLLYGLLPTGTEWPSSTHPNRLPVLLKSAISSTGPTALYCPCNQGSSSFLASNLDLHLSSMEHNAFIEACLPTLRLDGSTKLPFMVHDLEDDDTGRFNPVKLDRRSNLEDLPLPAAKRLCPAPTENNDTDMDVDRAFSASMMQTNAPLSQASADIHPPLANAIVQLHELCKTHDLSPAAMADLLQVFRISLETEADYTQKSRKGGQ